MVDFAQKHCKSNEKYAPTWGKRLWLWQKVDCLNPEKDILGERGFWKIGIQKHPCILGHLESHIHS